jgi:hypothetical protein
MKRIIAFGVILLLSATAIQAEISLTVYQRDLVLVRDIRVVDLQKGENRIVFDNVSSGIYEPTIRIVVPKDLSDVKTIEQNYNYDLASVDRIWHKFLGKPFQFTKNDSLYKGILRNFDDDYIYLEPEGKPGAISLVSRSGVENNLFESLPEGLVLRPEIVWRVRSGQNRKGVEVEVSYLTKGITWQADYTALLINDNRLQLVGNLTLVNSLDMSFPDAEIELMAGSPHRSFDAKQLSDADAPASPQAAAERQGARFFEYRRYHIPEKTTIYAQQSKGIPLIGPIEFTAERDFFFDGSAGAEEVEVRLIFANNKESGLGIALPEGDLLVYQKDDQGRMQFLGEDHLQASSPGDKVELVVGKAFDLRVDRKRMDHERIARNRTRDVVEITFASSREKPAKITVRERLYGFWEITEAAWAETPVSHRVEDANRVEFEVELPAGVSRTLRYTVEYGY